MNYLLEVANCILLSAKTTHDMNLLDIELLDAQVKIGQNMNFYFSGWDLSIYCVIFRKFKGTL